MDKSLLTLAATAVLGTTWVSAQTAPTGQAFPNRPVRVVTGSPGGGSDFSARLIAQGISGPLGQPVIVENRPTGVVPPDIVSKALPDGYTLLLTGSNFWIGPLLQKVPFDPVNDFSPITVMDRSPLVLAAHPSVAVKSVQELIALAKAKPGTLNYGSSATGGPTHLAAELFKSMAHVNLVYVPYKGTGPAATALLGGEIQLLFAAPVAVTPHVKTGKLVALACTAAQPSVLCPGLPPIAAAVPGYEMVGNTGIFAPAKTPTAVIKRLNQEMVRFIKTPEAKEKLLGTAAEAVGSSPEELGATVKADRDRLGKVIKDAGIKL